MTMKNYSIANDKARRQLKSLIERLSDADLLRANANGWTVAAILAHLAFWDQRAILLGRRWKETGVQPSPMDTDIINDVLLPFFLKIPSRETCQLAVEMAGTIDDEIAALSPALTNDIMQNAKQFRLDRAKHRDEHIAEIERLLDI
jgi:hypothetical protein